MPNSPDSTNHIADLYESIYRSAARRNLGVGFCLGILASVLTVKIWGLL